MIVNSESPEMSLCIATLNRPGQLNTMLESIVTHSASCRKIEIIIVDQHGNAAEIAAKYKDSFHSVIYHRDTGTGLSRARNIGIGKARGTIIGIPDDDCWFENDMLDNVPELIRNWDVIQLPVRLADTGDARSYQRKCLGEDSRISKGNFLYLISSNGLYFKRETTAFRFDDDIGAGRTYGSCEDLYWMWTLLKNGKTAMFYKSEGIFHPRDLQETVSRKRVIHYGLGQGLFWRRLVAEADGFWKLRFIAEIVANLVFHSIHMFLSALLLKKGKTSYRYWLIVSRIAGMLKNVSVVNRYIG